MSAQAKQKPHSEGVSEPGRAAQSPQVQASMSARAVESFYRSNSELFECVSNIPWLKTLPLGLELYPFADAAAIATAKATIGVFGDLKQDATPPQRCSRCMSHASRYCSVNPGAQTWSCAICDHSNQIHSRALDAGGFGGLTGIPAEFSFAQYEWTTPLDSSGSSTMGAKASSFDQSSGSLVLILDERLDERTARAMVDSICSVVVSTPGCRLALSIVSVSSKGVKLFKLARCGDCCSTDSTDTQRLVEPCCDVLGAAYFPVPTSDIMQVCGNRELPVLPRGIVARALGLVDIDPMEPHRYSLTDTGFLTLDAGSILEDSSRSQARLYDVLTNIWAPGRMKGQLDLASSSATLSVEAIVTSLELVLQLRELTSTRQTTETHVLLALKDSGIVFADQEHGNAYFPQPVLKRARTMLRELEAEFNLETQLKPGTRSSLSDYAPSHQSPTSSADEPAGEHRLAAWLTRITTSLNDLRTPVSILRFADESNSSTVADAPNVEEAFREIVHVTHGQHVLFPKSTNYRAYSESMRQGLTGLWAERLQSIIGSIARCSERDRIQLPSITLIYRPKQLMIDAWYGARETSLQDISVPEGSVKIVTIEPIGISKDTAINLEYKFLQDREETKAERSFQAYITWTSLHHDGTSGAELRKHHRVIHAAFTRADSEFQLLLSMVSTRSKESGTRFSSSLPTEASNAELTLALSFRRLARLFQRTISLKLITNTILERIQQLEQVRGKFRTGYTELGRAVLAHNKERVSQSELPLPSVSNKRKGGLWRFLGFGGNTLGDGENTNDEQEHDFDGEGTSSAFATAAAADFLAQVIAQQTQVLLTETELARLNNRVAEAITICRRAERYIEDALFSEDSSAEESDSETRITRLEATEVVSKSRRKQSLLEIKAFPLRLHKMILTLKSLFNSPVSCGSSLSPHSVKEVFIDAFQRLPASLLIRRVTAPVLQSFDSTGKLEPIPSSTLALQRNRILVLNAHTCVFIWSGSAVASETFDPFRKIALNIVSSTIRREESNTMIGFPVVVSLITEHDTSARSLLEVTGGQEGPCADRGRLEAASCFVSRLNPAHLDGPAEQRHDFSQDELRNVVALAFHPEQLSFKQIIKSCISQ